MLQNIVGSSLLGATDLKSTAEKSVEKDFKSSRSEASFGKALNDKMSQKAVKKEADKTPKDQEPTQKEASNQKAENKAEQTVVKPKAKKADRSQAIKEFMDSFESEFEIPSTRLVEAMGQLEKSELAKSPDETADAVIEKLGLDEADAEKARAMYASLLHQLNQIKDQQVKDVEFASGGSGIGQQQMQQRLLADQGIQNNLSNSVENLNKKFWSSEAENTKQVDILNEIPPHLRGQMSESVSPELLAELAAKRAEAQEAAILNKEALQDISGETSLMDEFQQVANQAENEQTGDLQNSLNANNQGQTADSFGQNMNDSKNDADFRTEKKTEFRPLMAGMDGLSKHSIKGEMFNYTQAPVVNTAPTVFVDHADEQAAIKQVMNQAQFLVNKGGGEMNVQLTPEGMGTIHMKVLLQDGKVNLQMSADTAEAKKTIESSLSELKTNLATHKLSMENVKIDVVSSASADTAAQNQTNNQNGHGQREQARQFWNQFNDNFGSQGRRESFAEMPNLRGYGQKDRNPLKPIDAAAQAKARKVEGRGSGLNLVA